MNKKPVLDVQKIYRLNELSEFSDIPLFGVIGNPIDKSLSHVVHNRIFASLGLPAKFVRIHLEEEELPKVFMMLRGGLIRGLAVTMPFKTKCYLQVDDASPTAQASGSVNTLILREGKVYGENTDGPAAEELLSEFFMHRPKVTLLGAGGTAQSIAYILKKNNVAFSIYNRTLKHAKQLASLYGASYGSSQNCTIDPLDSLHLLINASSIGMTPFIDATPISTDMLSANTVVFDVVYSPQKTLLIQEAEKKGLKTIPGTEMFFAQAAKQAEQFVGYSFHREKIEKMFD